MGDTIQLEELPSRVAVLEVLHVAHEKRVDRVEAAVDQIKGLSWGVLGAVVLQAVIVVAVIFTRKVVP